MAVNEAFERIQQYAARLSDLPFKRTNAFARAVLMSSDEFEAMCVREGEPHEASLFQPTATRSNVTQQLERIKLRQSMGGSSLPSALGPQRRTINAQHTLDSQHNHTDQVHGHIKALQKLLQIYPMPRAQDHVDALVDRYDHLRSEAIDQQDEIDDAPESVHDSGSIDMLQSTIKLERLELVALQATNADRRREISVLQKKKASLHKRQQAEQAAVAALAAAKVSQPVPEPEPTPAPPPRSKSVPQPPPGPAPVESDYINPAFLTLIATKASAVLGMNAGAKVPVILTELSAASEGQADSPALEAKLLHVLLASLYAITSHQPENKQVEVKFRDPPQSLLATHAASDFCNAANEMPMFAMSGLKTHLAPWTQERNMSGDLTTKAIYGLVAKGLLKIDRRTAREPLIFFDP